MLDSSPVPFTSHPNPPRPLKRSASTASLASLPTPPRTHRKHTRGHSRGSCDSDTDTDNDPSNLDSSHHPSLPTHTNATPTGTPNTTSHHHRYKRRKTKDSSTEDAFWITGPSSQPKLTESRLETSAPLLYRKRQIQTQTQTLAPVSPPPSHRKLITGLSLQTPPASLAGSKTPRTRSEVRAANTVHPASGASRETPSPGILDSPSNPFLDTPVKERERRMGVRTPLESTEEERYGEKPMMTYVFRGVRRTYPNYMWDHKLDKPRSPPLASHLPMDHPEYSPPVHVTPKLLFKDERGASGSSAVKRSEGVKTKTTGSASGVKEAASTGQAVQKGRNGKSLFSAMLDSDDEDEDGEGDEIRPMKLDFSVALGKAKGRGIVAATTRARSIAMEKARQTGMEKLTATGTTTTLNPMSSSKSPLKAITTTGGSKRVVGEGSRTHKRRVATLEQEFRDAGEKLDV